MKHNIEFLALLSCVLEDTGSDYVSGTGCHGWGFVVFPRSFQANPRTVPKIRQRADVYKGDSKISLWLVGKKKHVVVAPKCRLSSNKYGLLSLNAYPNTFSLRTVGVISDETWTLSSPLPPAVRYVLWFVFFTQKDKARLRVFVDCVVYTVMMLWVTVVWENGAENSGIGALICMTTVIKNDTQLWLMNWFKKSTNACVENFVSRYQNFLKNFHKLRGLLCIELSQTDWVTIRTVHGGYQKQLTDWLTWLHNLAGTFFEDGLQKLVSPYDKCLNVGGNNVEKWCSYVCVYVTVQYNTVLFSILYFFNTANRRLILELPSYQ